MAKKPMIHKKGQHGGKPGGGGQKGPNFKREFEVGGKRDAVELTVKITKGDQLATGEKVWFWLGTETQKRQKFLEDASGATKKLWELPTVRGYAQDKIDLSSPAHESYTHITAVHGNHGWEETKPLPVPDVVPVGSGASPKKAKRFKILPEVESIESADGSFSLSIITFDATGKTPTTDQLQLKTTVKTRVNNLTTKVKSTGKSHAIVTDAHGFADVEIFLVDDLGCDVTLIHPVSTETATKKFHIK